jgi:hypothetical protein
MMTPSLAASPFSSSRVLGITGILGGSVLLAAFLLEVPAGLNDVRIVLYVLGAIAVVVAVHRLQVGTSPILARIVAIAAVVANASVLLREVLPYGPWHPFAGDNGLVLFYAGIAMWLTDAAFGLVTLRLGVVTRWGAVALAVGSALAILGIDRLGLTSEANPTIFGSLALAGIALNGIAWIILGIAVVIQDRSSVRRESFRRERDVAGRR